MCLKIVKFLKQTPYKGKIEITLYTLLEIV